MNYMDLNKGVYTPPRKIEIAGIEALVVDPHNEVLPFWYGLNKTHSVVIHIDDHSDMNAGSRTFDNAKKEYPFADIVTLEDYARNCLGIESFISVAMHDRRVGAVYHIAPRHDRIRAYGRTQNDNVVGTPKTIVDESGRIKWEDGKLLPTYEEISEEELVQDVSGTSHPIILDIDLDAFHLNQVDSTDQPYSDRLEKTRKLLEQLPKPDIITISRSQTPTTYVNPMLIHKIQTDCLSMLEEVYK